MGNVNELGLVAETEDNRTQILELLHIQADVGPDGSSAFLAIHTQHGQIDLAVPIAQMAATIDEVTEAGSLMLQRQLHARDKGKSAFAKLMQAAPRPSSVAPTIDRATGDIVFVYRFADRLPFTVRVTMEQIIYMRAAFETELRRHSH